MAETWSEQQQRHARERVSLLRAILVAGGGEVCGAEVSVPELLEVLCEEVASRHRVSSEEMRGHCRRAALVEARREAYELMLRAEFSVSEVARFFRRDHTTVLFALRGAEGAAQRRSQLVAATVGALGEV
ncbi:helix-turn-helix domain-containing protein [Salipiger bermudensis]|uniref:helix-turn-helix domain-containing protein n=1 Tax=Salipiger bermudensis TaxID=344736 RepID=UPI001A8DBC62|nr:helix-turn-helix domain-containing protein [Salipiger bermudensis]MBN9674625.1 hypothetical protein [Salipiger bermudensis]